MQHEIMIEPSELMARCVFGVMGVLLHASWLNNAIMIRISELWA